MPARNRLIITGPNGAGKSHLAAQCSAARPDAPLISYDALRLTSNWQKKPQSEASAALSNAVLQDSWILEGGPSLLQIALPRADAVIWLDPPRLTRAARLFLRPLKSRGHTRPELPPGNPDRIGQQWRFGLRSLAKDRAFRATITQALSGHPDIPLWQCRRAPEIEEALTAWATGRPG